jgi:hypothetical protein
MDSSQNAVQHSASDAEDAARYRWLRDRKSAYGGYCGSAPFVMDPSRSRLYAIADLRSKALDLSVDADMLHTTVKSLHESNEINERGLMPEGASWRDLDGPYVDALYKLAKEELGYTDARFDAAMLASK